MRLILRMNSGELASTCHAPWTSQQRTTPLGDHCINKQKYACIRGFHNHTYIT